MSRLVFSLCRVVFGPGAPVVRESRIGNHQTQTKLPAQPSPSTGIEKHFEEE